MKAVKEKALELHQKATDECLAKGFLEKSPMITIPDRVEYIEDKGYIGKIIGRKRPLNAIEISHLYSMMEIKELISTLNLGITAYIITANGLAETNTARIDLVSTLRGLVTEILGLVKDGVELLIENRWLEKIPETANRRELIQ